MVSTFGKICLSDGMISLRFGAKSGGSFHRIHDFELENLGFFQTHLNTSLKKTVDILLGCFEIKLISRFFAQLFRVNLCQIRWFIQKLSNPGCFSRFLKQPYFKQNFYIATIFWCEVMCEHDEIHTIMVKNN